VMKVMMIYENPFGFLAERDSRTSELNAKIELFKKNVAELSDATVPNKELFAKYFSGNDISSLWSRLKRDRGQADITVAQAWEHICAMRGNQDKRKLKRLADMMVLKPGELRERLVTEMETIADNKTVGKQTREYTKGELINVLGADAALRGIAKGKCKKRLDEWEDEVYTKSTKYADESKSHERKAQDPAYHGRAAQHLGGFVPEMGQRLVRCLGVCRRVWGTCAEHEEVRCQNC